MEKECLSINIFFKFAVLKKTDRKAIFYVLDS